MRAVLRAVARGMLRRAPRASRIFLPVACPPLERELALRLHGLVSLARRAAAGELAPTRAEAIVDEADPEPLHADIALKALSAQRSRRFHVPTERLHRRPTAAEVSANWARFRFTK